MQEIITQTKICSKCKVEQELSCFNKNKQHKDGLSYKCKTCISIYDKKMQDSKRERRAELRIINKDKIAKTSRNYYDNNIESMKEYSRNYYIKNKERAKALRAVRDKTPEGKAIIFNYCHKRRTLKKQGDVTTKQLLELQDNAKVCYWCNESLRNKKTHIDHYKPLSKGGKHTISNLVISCSTCNRIKSAKDPLKFANSLGRLL